MADILQFQTTRFRAEHLQVLPELEIESLLFVDWLTISQEHPGGGLPKIIDGYFTSSDGDGVIEYETHKTARLEGSYDHTMWLKCDGHRVYFHGNISRWGRPDNVFGYGWEETLRRVNGLLNLHSLPPFTSGDLLRFADKGHVYTGARVSRIDITKNYATFSAQDAQQLIFQLAAHHRGRQKGTVSSDGISVLYGYGSNGSGSSYASGKCYLKHAEIKNHRRKKSGAHVGADVEQWCYDLGVVREEFTLKSRFLTQKQCCWIAQINQQILDEHYKARSQLKRLKDMEYHDTTSLSEPARAALARYEQGEPINLKKTKFYRVRRELISAGYADISVPKNITPIRPAVKVIEIQQLCAPDWYRRKYG